MKETLEKSHRVTIYRMASVPQKLQNCQNEGNLKRGYSLGHPKEVKNKKYSVLLRWNLEWKKALKPDVKTWVQVEP